jgi:uncharacterized iron-regulated membrane protein
MLHRWAGLTITLFLVVVGMTGALLPWNEDLTLLARPALSTVSPPSAAASLLDGITLAEKIEDRTGGKVDYIPLRLNPLKVAIISVRPKNSATLGYDTVWADPYTGAILLKYRDGKLADGPQTIMSFLYSLHSELALGDVGRYTLGVAALIWTLDCFVGLYLTFPIRRTHTNPAASTARTWWARWGAAFRVRWFGGSTKLTFDLHRAGGLWLWPMLLVFAWSSVNFNLTQVSTPVMRMFGAAESVDLPTLAAPLKDPPIGPRQARVMAEKLLSRIAERERFQLEESVGMNYYAENAAYRFNARSDLDIVSEGGRTIVYFSAVDGHLLKFDRPVSRNGANAFMGWLSMLHLAQVFGLPYRILVSFIGLVIVTLSVTGVLIWMKKRSARLLRDPAVSRRPSADDAQRRLPA